MDKDNALKRTEDQKRRVEKVKHIAQINSDLQSQQREKHRLAEEERLLNHKEFGMNKGILKEVLRDEVSEEGQAKLLRVKLA